MAADTSCPKHNVELRYCPSCKAVFCFRCTGNAYECPECGGGNTRAANSWEVKDAPVRHYDEQ
jgi:predicted RNA-binding Zn-ribbon protein involved in translation (DUF1610 family)